MDFLILICSLFTLIVTINAGPTDDHPHMQNLSGLCSDLKESITEGSFVARKKILDECAAKSFTTEQSKAMEKCRAKLPLETPTDVEKVCSDMKTYEPKFQELRTCFKSNGPGPSSKKTFKDCLIKALGKI
ncbi:uncharacterized protein LOC128393844 [Panonychus citri]|uniref:uncharacterized protein LOC128391004 n=1 Tax=Panonychus citri TaxID=50023 RepID=UPI0023070DC5|nr:uncharacterized protein LOC128391004 [Panonychus citri]XP_053210053.1 uncharacterized protein LOC128393844 [Panonychus citri]